MTSEASITLCRGRRSAHTPPIGSEMTRARVEVARTRPRALAERAMERVAKARATGTMASPNAETPWPIHKSRKLGWVRGERAAGSGIRRLQHARRARRPQVVRVGDEVDVIPPEQLTTIFTRGPDVR